MNFLSTVSNLSQYTLFYTFIPLDFDFFFERKKSLFFLCKGITRLFRFNLTKKTDFSITSSPKFLVAFFGKTFHIFSVKKSEEWNRCFDRLKYNSNILSLDYMKFYSIMNEKRTKSWNTNDFSKNRNMLKNFHKGQL